MRLQCRSHRGSVSKHKGGFGMKKSNYKSSGKTGAGTVTVGKGLDWHGAYWKPKEAAAGNSKTENDLDISNWVPDGTPHPYAAWEGQIVFGWDRLGWFGNGALAVMMTMTDVISGLVFAKIQKDVSCVSKLDTLEAGLSWYGVPPGLLLSWGANMPPFPADHEMLAEEVFGRSPKYKILCLLRDLEDGRAARMDTICMSIARAAEESLYRLERILAKQIEWRGIVGIEETNRFLAKIFLYRYNRNILLKREKKKIR
jgi:hypothetical protein